MLQDFPAGVEVVVKLMRRMPFSGDSGLVIDTVTVPASSTGDRHRRVRVSDMMLSLNTVHLLKHAEQAVWGCAKLDSPRHTLWAV
jgi:hypothetical protein